MLYFTFHSLYALVWTLLDSPTTYRVDDWVVTRVYLCVSETIYKAGNPSLNPNKSKDKTVREWHLMKRLFDCFNMIVKVQRKCFIIGIKCYGWLTVWPEWANFLSSRQRIACKSSQNIWSLLCICTGNASSLGSNVTDGWHCDQIGQFLKSSYKSSQNIWLRLGLF